MFWVWTLGQCPVQAWHGSGISSQSQVSASGQCRPISGRAELCWPMRGRGARALTSLVWQHRPSEPASTLHWHFSHITFHSRERRYIGLLLQFIDVFLCQAILFYWKWTIEVTSSHNSLWKHNHKENEDAYEHGIWFDNDMDLFIRPVQ